MKQKEPKFTVSLQIKEHDIVNKTPAYQVYFDDALRLNWDAMVCNVGQHNIKIKFLNKNSSTDTEVDHEGNVIRDLAVELFSLKVDKFDITHHAKEHAEYTDEEGINLDNTYGYLHKNGTLDISFSCPVFYHTRNLNLIKK